METKQNISRNKQQWKHDNSKPMRCGKGRSKRDVYSYAILPQERRKTSSRQPNFIPETTGKRTSKQTNKKKLVEGKKS